jgi:hypothetical protein
MTDSAQRMKLRSGWRLSRDQDALLAAVHAGQSSILAMR